MAFREVNVIEIREVLRGWLAGAGLRTVAAQAGVDRKTARRYVLAAQQAGVRREGGQGLTVVKIGVLLQRRGVTVPYRTLHRFCVQCCGFGRGAQTVRVADGDPG